jgi:hypothetical protein
MKTWYNMCILLAIPAVAGAQLPPPIIDMHLHAHPADSQGPPPLALCLPVTSLGSAGSGTSWRAELLSGYKEPGCSQLIWSPETDEELVEETIALMERRNIVGVTSGTRREMWQERAPERIIPGSRVLFNGGPRSIPLNVLRSQFTSGFVQIFGEVTIHLS